MKTDMTPYIAAENQRRPRQIWSRLFGILYYENSIAI